MSDKHIRRLAVAATAAGCLLLLMLAAAAVSRASQAARHVPTIVTDRPLTAAPENPKATVVPQATEVPAVTALQPSGTPESEKSSTSSGSGSSTSKSGKARVPRRTTKAPTETVKQPPSAVEDLELEDDDHEFVHVLIREEEPGGDSGPSDDGSDR